MAVISHVKVQRGSVSFGSGGTSTTVAISAVGSLSSAFARVTGVHHGGADPTAGGTSNKNNIDDGAYALLTSTTVVTITLAAGATAEDRTVYWEVWEYTGPSGGEHEFIVKEHTICSIPNAATTHTQTTNVSGTKTNMAIVHCGQTNAVSAQSLGNALAQLNLTGASPNINVKALRGGNSAVLDVAYALVEFTGSRWTMVQLENQALTSSAIGADVSIAISSVTDWSKTMILPGGHQLPSTTCTNADTALTIRPGADVTHIKARLSSAHSNPGGNICVFTCYMVYNPFLVVNRADSITGGGTAFTGGGSAPQTQDVTITDLVDTSHAALQAWVDNDSSATSYPSGQWVYTLQASTTARFFRARTVGGGNWALAGIDFNGVGYYTQSLGPQNVSIQESVSFSIQAHLLQGVSIMPTLRAQTSFHMLRSVSVSKSLYFQVVAPLMLRSVTITPTLAPVVESSAVAVRVSRVTAEWAVRRAHQAVTPL